MASKDAIVCLLDVSQTMEPNINVAKEAIKSLTQWKMLQGKTNEIGVLLFGSDATFNTLNDSQGGYEHIFQFAPIDRPSVDLLRNISGISTCNQAGDLIEGLIVALDMIRARTQNKKYNRKIYLITDGENPVEGSEDLPAVVDMMKGLDVQLVVMGIGFTCKPFNVGLKGPAVKAEPSFSQEEDTARAGEIKYENEKTLLSIARATGGSVIPSKNLPDMMASMNCKQTNPRKLKMPLEITPALTIQAQYFGKTSQAKPPSMVKESLKSFDSTDPESGKVKQDKTYRDPDQPDDEISYEDRIKGYRYGKDYIPVTADIEEDMKLKSESASMKVLGFTNPATIQRCFYMGTTLIVIGEAGVEKAAIAISALAQAMKRQQQAAIVRFVRQKNADPQIGVLFPDLNCSYDRFVYEQLPFYEDLRSFTFPSFGNLKQGLAPTKFQEAAAGRLIENMMLSRNGVDLMKLEEIFNPALQRVYSCMIARAINPKCELVPADPHAEACLLPNKELVAWAKDALLGFASSFTFKKVEKAKTSKRKTFWSDLEADGAADGGEEAKKMKEESKEGFAGPSEVGTVTPIEDFEAIIGCGNVEAILGAINQMQAVIEKIVKDGASTAYYKKALGCLKSLRSSCIVHAKAALFNVFLRSLKENFQKGPHGGFWDIIVESNVSLCTTEDDGSLLVTPEEALEFLKEQIKYEELPIPEPVKDDEDLFGDMA